MRDDARKEIDIEACLASGGKVEGVGIFGVSSCVAYYADGGKRCTDNSQCHGLCFIPTILKIGTLTQGVCQSSERDSFDCISTIKDGVVNDAFCQD